jgi:hypothetical protein
LMNRRRNHDARISRRFLRALKTSAEAKPAFLRRK